MKCLGIARALVVGLSGAYSSKQVLNCTALPVTTVALAGPKKKMALILLETLRMIVVLNHFMGLKNTLHWQNSTSHWQA